MADNLVLKTCCKCALSLSVYVLRGRDNNDMNRGGRETGRVYTGGALVSSAVVSKGCLQVAGLT